MKTTLKLEELAMLLLGIYTCNLLDFHWGVFLVLFFAPDLGMLGYLFGNKAGALTYNLLHHKGIAIGIWLAGRFYGIDEMQLAGIILFSHASFDRLLGYGLKYTKGFKFTHTGEIGKQSVQQDTNNAQPG